MDGNKRVLEIELLKAVAITGMVFIHILELSPCLTKTTSGPGYYICIMISFFGGIASGGVFMFAMGWGGAFSGRSTPKTYLERVLRLILLGLLVNVFQQWIPMYLRPDMYGSISEKWYTLFAVDIYAFAAVAMLYLALMRGLLKHERLVFAVSVALLFISLLINGLTEPESFSTGSDLGDTLLGVFVRENEYSYFPFVSWIFFPVTGFISGKLFQKLGRKRFLVFLAVTGTLTLVPASIIMYVRDIPNAVLAPYFVTDTEYYALDNINLICSYGLIAYEFIIATFVIRLVKNRLPGIILYMSRSVMHIYLFQWLFIGLLSGVISKTVSLPAILLISAVVLVSANGYCILRDRFLADIKSRNKANKLSMN